jgi:glycosyltransferase involved in cell wall biosynthesis
MSTSVSAPVESNRESAATKSCRFTAVIIGRNEEQFIGGAIQSLLKLRSEVPDAEIIFVDSASRDRSVEVAKNFPITILQLPADWPLGVGAGRYTGYRWSHGEYIFFLDGDAVAEAKWLNEAMGFLDKHPDYAAVAGVLDEEYVDAQGVHSGGAPNVFGQDLSQDVIDSKVLGGIAMYRRSVLEQVGTVHPFLPTAEDHELCLRIRRGGWKVARIKGRMAIKYTEDRNTLYEVLRRARTKMYDYGAVLKYCQQYGAGWQYCIDTIPYLVSFALVIATFVAAIPVAIYFGKLLWLVVAAVALFLAIAAKKRSFKGALLSIAVRSVSLLKTVLSYVRTTPKSPAEYPTDVIHVQ